VAVADELGGFLLLRRHFRALVVYAASDVVTSRRLPTSRFVRIPSRIVSVASCSGLVC